MLGRLSMQLLKGTKHKTEKEHKEVSIHDEDTEDDTEYSDEETDIVTHKIGLTDSEEDDNRGQEVGGMCIQENSFRI